jgi:hypothetical protein
MLIIYDAVDMAPNQNLNCKTIPQPDPAMATRKMATAERVARQREQQGRLGGLVFTPETIPANHLVDLFVEMCESGILSYIKPEQCCSRAQEVHSIKKDPTVSTDSSGMLKLGSKAAEPTCEANTELKLRSAWQRRNLAMDLAGLASFETLPPPQGATSWPVKGFPAATAGL